MDTLQEYYRRGGHGGQTASSIEAVIEAEKRYPNSTVDARRIVSILEKLAPGDRLLDVGSGYGFYAREASRRGFRVDALELSPFERRCTRELADVEPEPITFEAFSAERGSYDAILMSQILEHVVEPRAWAMKAGRLLTPGGVLGVATPNFNSFLRLLLGSGDPLVQPPDHLNHFSRDGLSRLLARAPFRVTSVISLSRLPGTAITDRVPLPGRLERLTERLFQAVQRPLLWPLDTLGLGMFLNVYAHKVDDS